MASNEMDPHEALANAIILQAVKDYRMALKRVKKNPRNKEAISEALALEKFFRSSWYSTLTSVDGDFLIQKLQEEISAVKNDGEMQKFSEKINELTQMTSDGQKERFQENVKQMIFEWKEDYRKKTRN